MVINPYTPKRTKRSSINNCYYSSLLPFRGRNEYETTRNGFRFGSPTPVSGGETGFYSMFTKGLCGSVSVVSV